MDRRPPLDAHDQHDEQPDVTVREDDAHESKSDDHDVDDQNCATGREPRAAHGDHRAREYQDAKHHADAASAGEQPP